MNKLPPLLLALEILLLLACIAIFVYGLFPLPVIPLILVAWGSLHFRHMGWRDVGFRRPEHWLSTISLGLFIGVAYQFLDIYLVSPVLENITRQPVNLAQFSGLRGNLLLLLVYLLITWTEAAFLEEMFFRGYFFNRLTDLFGNRRLGITLALVLSAIAFGLAHGYQDITGVIDTALAGLVLGGLYLLTRRNLWLPILVHGVVDTVGFLLLFFGVSG